MSAIIYKGELYSYRRGLRSCLSIRGGKFEGQDCEISNGYESHAFSFKDWYDFRAHFGKDIINP